MDSDPETTHFSSLNGAPAYIHSTRKLSLANFEEHQITFHKVEENSSSSLPQLYEETKLLPRYMNCEIDKVWKVDASKNMSLETHRDVKLMSSKRSGHFPCANCGKTYCDISSSQQNLPQRTRQHDLEEQHDPYFYHMSQPSRKNTSFEDHQSTFHEGDENLLTNSQDYYDYTPLRFLASEEHLEKHPEENLLLKEYNKHRYPSWRAGHFPCSNCGKGRNQFCRNYEDPKNNFFEVERYSSKEFLELHENNQLGFFPSEEYLETNTEENLLMEDYLYKKMCPSKRPGHFPCSNCGKVYNYKRSLDHHLKFECENTSSYSHSSPSNRTKDKAVGQELNNEESPVPYVCGGPANKRSVPRIGFEDRQSTSPRDEKKSLVNVPEVNENSHCTFLPTGENFGILENFQIEEYQYRKEYPSTRAGQFPCSNCGKVYRYQRNMSYHMKFECGKEPQFQCPLCSLRMKQRRNLRRHDHPSLNVQGANDLHLVCYASLFTIIKQAFSKNAGHFPCSNCGKVYRYKRISSMGITLFIIAALYKQQTAFLPARLPTGRLLQLLARDGHSASTFGQHNSPTSSYWVTSVFSAFKAMGYLDTMGDQRVAMLVP
uniref:C2H2-type domain-containing protein n=1 Tax=Timema cristinae TaxID=61476 RepID=A0A7R9CYD5_TIMCR|nr:unnamed protein product [Timema cristinae]